MVFRVVTWIITVIIGAVPALCKNAPFVAALNSKNASRVRLFAGWGGTASLLVVRV